MKNLLILAAATIGLLAFNPSANAQIITWGSAQSMVGTSDISTLGTFVDAIDFNSTRTIGDTTFNQIAAGNGASDGTISLTGPLNAFGGTSFVPSPASPDYLAVMSSIAFTIGAPGSIDLAGLTAGDTYEVELWFSYNGDPGQAANTTFSGPAGSNSVTLIGGLNEFALGTFTATSSTESIGFTPGTNYAVFNAVSLRNVSAVPEPSTYLLLGLGFLTLVVVQKRRLLS